MIDWGAITGGLHCHVGLTMMMMTRVGETDVHLQHFVSLQRIEALGASLADLQRALKTRASPSITVSCTSGEEGGDDVHSCLSNDCTGVQVWV